jgi:hypothetical protein
LIRVVIWLFGRQPNAAWKNASAVQLSFSLWLDGHAPEHRHGLVG